MSQAESKFTPRPCARCGRPVLTGEAAGYPMRVDVAVPPEHARVLAHYGHPVIVLINRFTGLWPADYDPHRPPADGAYLAAAHICGSPHARRLEGMKWTKD